MVPSVRRTWALRGKTPILKVAGRWTKISAISALSVSPKRRRIALYARFYKDKNIRSCEAAGFLRHLLRHIQGPIVLLWDSGTIHGGTPVKEILAKHSRLHVYRFPGYAPELNPDEFVWNNLKGRLANSVPEDASHLKRLLGSPLARLRQSQKLLWSCIYASELPWK
ncbi:MAG: transposase [Elusimicrobia bacterium]|nr:transposase [Elusimicrobiota bacterium]